MNGRVSPGVDLGASGTEETRMFARTAIVVVAAIAAAATGAVAVAKDKKPDIKPSVTYAKSWDQAIAEAKLLNVPIVVHSHGFY
jgi:hypothetical protein